MENQPSKSQWKCGEVDHFSIECRVSARRRSAAGDARDDHRRLQCLGVDGGSFVIVCERVGGDSAGGRSKCTYSLTTSLEWWPNPRDCPQVGHFFAEMDYSRVLCTKQEILMS